MWIETGFRVFRVLPVLESDKHLFFFCFCLWLFLFCHTVCAALCGDCSLCFQSLFVLAARKLRGGVVERHVAKSIVWMCSFQRWSGGVERADNQRDEKFGTTCRWVKEEDFQNFSLHWCQAKLFCYESSYQEIFSSFCCCRHILRPYPLICSKDTLPSQNGGGHY